MDDKISAIERRRTRVRATGAGTSAGLIVRGLGLFSIVAEKKWQRDKSRYPREHSCPLARRNVSNKEADALVRLLQRRLFDPVVEAFAEVKGLTGSDARSQFLHWNRYGIDFPGLERSAWEGSTEQERAVPFARAVAIDVALRLAGFALLVPASGVISALSAWNGRSSLFLFVLARVDRPQPRTKLEARTLQRYLKAAREEGPPPDRGPSPATLDWLAPKGLTGTQLRLASLVDALLVLGRERVGEDACADFARGAVGLAQAAIDLRAEYEKSRQDEFQPLAAPKPEMLVELMVQGTRSTYGEQLSAGLACRVRCPVLAADLRRGARSSLPWWSDFMALLRASRAHGNTPCAVPKPLLSRLVSPIENSFQHLDSSLSDEGKVGGLLAAWELTLAAWLARPRKKRPRSGAVIRTQDAVAALRECQPKHPLVKLFQAEEHGRG